MTAEVLHEMNGLLAEQVDAFAAALEQRDLARRIAVQLEQELAELRRAVEAKCAELERGTSITSAGGLAVGRAFRSVLASVGATTEVQP